MRARILIASAIGVLLVSAGAVVAMRAGGCCLGIFASAAEGHGCEAESDRGSSVARGSVAERYDSVMSVACRMACEARDLPAGTKIVAQPEAKPGDVTRCPVSGVAFIAAADGPEVTIEDKTYRPCCDVCAGKLQEEPARFLNL